MSKYKGWKIWKGPSTDAFTGWAVGDPLWRAERFGVDMRANSKEALKQMIDLKENPNKQLDFLNPLCQYSPMKINKEEMKKHEFWCEVCDGKIVDSTKPETGKFYSVSGCLWSAPDEFNGDYKSVLFAVCPDCDPMNALCEHKT